MIFLCQRISIENGPTCYRAPKWPDPEFPQKIPKNTPQAEIMEPHRNTRKYRKNTKSGHFWYLGGIFSVFSGSFGGKFWESRISGRGGIIWVFFVEIPGFGAL